MNCGTLFIELGSKGERLLIVRDANEYTVTVRLL